MENDLNGVIVMKIGRNHLCPCGSGKKYKFCCGKDENKVVDFLAVQSRKEKASIPEELIEFLKNEYLGEFKKEMVNTTLDCSENIKDILKQSENIIYLESFMLHKVLSCGQTILEKFIKKNEKGFRKVTLDWLDSCKNIYFSLYQIDNIDKYKGEIVVKEIYTNQRYVLRYENKYRYFKLGEVIWCELVKDEEYYRPFFGIYAFNVTENEAIIQKIVNIYKEHKSDIREFMRENYLSIHKILFNKNDDFLNDYVSDSEKRMFTLFWLHYANSELNGMTPLEAFNNLDYRNRVENILNRQKERNKQEENLMFSLCRKMIIEHLGLGESKLITAEEYNWPKGLYKKTALSIEKNLKNKYTPLQISRAIKIWHDLLKVQKPRIVKTIVWVAVIDYILNIIEEGPSITQKEIASIYKLAPSTISNRYLEVTNVLKIVPLDVRYSTVYNEDKKQMFLSTDKK